MNCNHIKNNNCCGYRISDDLLNLGQVGQQGPQGEIGLQGIPGGKGKKGLRATAGCQSPQVMQISSIHRNKQSNSQQCREVFFLSTQLRFPKALN